MKSNSFSKADGQSVDNSVPYDGFIPTKWEFARRLMTRHNVSYNDYYTISGLILPTAECVDSSEMDVAPKLPLEDTILRDNSTGFGLKVNPSIMTNYENYYTEDANKIMDILVSKSPLLSKPLSTKDIAKDFDEEFRSGFDLHNISHVYEHVDISLEDYLREKLSLANLEAENYRFLTTATKDQLVAKFDFDVSVFNELLESFKSLETDFYQAVNLVSKTLISEQKERAFLSILSSFSYYEKTLGNLNQWKLVIKAMEATKKEYGENADVYWE